jgi:hypothetical protein
MARVRTVEFLPEIFQTPVNRQFLNATLDQLTQEPAFQKTQGYVGRKVGPGVNPVDKYVIEPTKVRNDYQLEPGVITLEPDTNKIIDAITYPGILDALNLQGANVANPNRLFESNYYTWDPFVDFDKFVNYSQYYWLPEGPDAVDISSTAIPLTDNFVVTRANGVYSFSGVAGNNPAITLLREGNYTFEVAQNDKEDVNFRVQNSGTSAYVIDFQNNPTLTLVRGNTYTFTLVLNGIFPFYIKTQPTLGTTNLYNNGVTNNGASQGQITFTVPQDAPDTLYYLNNLQFNMRGEFNIIDGTPGTGPGFWIQTDPGVNGRIPSTPNISSRDVLGVLNNGEDLGTVTFDVPSSTAQNFYYTLSPIGNIPGKASGTVDLVTTLQFDQLNNQFLEPFLVANPTGIDGITSLNGKTIAFLNTDSAGWEITTQFDPLPNEGNIQSPSGSYDSTAFDQTTPVTPAQRYDIWQIQYVTTVGGSVFMQLNPVLTVNNLEKFSVQYGTTYSNTSWYKNAEEYFEQIPLLTAIRDVLFYQDGTDPEIFGQIRLIDQNRAATIFVEDILNQKNYTSPNGVVFTNGLKIVFQGDVEPASYANREYYVEGVGTAIKLLPVINFVTPETYTQSATVPYDSTPYDVGNYDATLNAPLLPDYLTVNRASLDLNPWTRSNRWFHIDVILASAQYNNTVPIVDNDFRARRPIIEFRAGTRLFDFGTEGKQPVNIIDFESTDALSEINGTTGYSTDGYSFINGSRVIFANDSDAQVRNKIYQVEFIIPDTVPPLIAQPIINLVPAPDANVLIDQNTVCLSGTTQQGKSYYFDGVAWLPAQDKTATNQPPLFEVYDSTGISFSNRAKYPSSNFIGSKLFSYATSSTTADPVLGFALRYLSLANVGDIVFDNNLYTDTFEYVTGSVGKTQNISEGFVRQYRSRVNFTKEIGWQPAVTPSLVRQQFQFTYDEKQLKLDVAVDTNNTVPAVQLFVNSQFQDPSNYSYITTSTTTTITLLKKYVPGDVIEVAVLSDQISKNGFYQVPINLENNPLNGNSTTFTLGTIRSHYETIGQNLISIQGNIIGANNTRDLGNIVPYGLQILQQSSPLTLSGYFMRSQEYDIFNSVEYNSREYIKFKSLLLETVTRNEYNLNQTTAQILDLVIAEITQGRTDVSPFYWSDMIPTGSVYTQIENVITPITTTVFNTRQTYNFSSSNYLGLLVYLNDTLLIRDTQYVVSDDSPSLEILVPLAVGDTVVIREYSGTYGNFVPNTPSKMGLYPKFVPQLFLDINATTPVPVIQGHDGSITKAFGDIRDDILLEFEKRIYNNIKMDNNPVPLTQEDVIPGFFRTTNYSQAEITSILGENFLTWVGWNKLDYKNQNYDSTNPFTYNYSSAGNKINNEPLLGAWRGIYKYFYDTTSPNLTPWEMLGFSEQPNWWEQRYGPAPYTSDNLVLWDDLEIGLVADPVAPYIRPQYARPGLTTVIPNSTEGELLPPVNSVVGPYDPTAFQKSWVVGDGGPVEASWWASSSYPFAVMRLLILTRPAEFFSLFADRDLYKFDIDLNQYLYNGRYRLDANGVEVYGNGVSKASYINWIVDYNQQLGRNSTDALTRDLSNLDVRLCYRTASFTDKQYLKIFVERSSPNSTNSSLLLPDDSYNLLLYKNQPFAKILYSALNVERTADGYSVYGYNNATPYFEIFASASNGRLQTVSGGGAEVRVPAQYTNDIIKIPYGYVFTNTTMMVDFILSYGKYLESQGLIFDDRENGYTLNWNQMASEFLYFSQQGWATGTIINLNPSATSLKAVRAESVVDSIISTSPENMLLDQNRQTLPTRDLIINREDDAFSITSASQSAISYLNMKFTSYEHMIILDNVSVFQDLVFDTITGARQNRIKVTAATTTEWNGTLNAQGFILNQNNVREWQPNRKYTKGEIVIYKNNYWAAQTIVQPKVEFNFDDWTKSDYTLIQQGLLPNLANKANQLANTYSTTVANLEEDNDLLSYGLIGFRPRQYMSDLNLDDVSQVNIYQQFLGDKGTRRAAELFTRADLGKESGQYNIYENWGVLVSTYGANANRSFIELRLNEAFLRSNPCTVQVVQTEQVSQANQTILLDDVWRESYALTTTDILPTTYLSNPDTALPSAGYVNIDDVDITVFDLNDPSNLSANIDQIGVGTTIWVAKSNSYDWNVYRCGKVPGQLSQLADNLNGTSIARFTQAHGLSVGDLIVIRLFDPAVNGVYRVLATPSVTQITIAFAFGNTNQTIITGTGIAFDLQSMRVSQASDVALLPYANALIPGVRAYVDNNGQGHWQVLEKQDPFTGFDEFSAGTPVGGGLFGSSVAQSQNLFSALIGSPGYNSSVGAVYAYKQNTETLNYVQDVVITLATTGTVGYGEQVRFGSNSWAAVSADRSNGNHGYVTTLYRNPVTGGFSQTQLLLRPSPSVDPVRFGSSLAVSQDERWLYVGAPFDSNGGKVYAFARVDVESQSVSYLTDGSTFVFTYNDNVVIDYAQPDQLLVLLNGNLKTEGVDYVVTPDNVVFNSPPITGQTLIIRRRTGVEFVGDGSTTTYALDPYLYTVSTIDSITVLIDGILQRPYIDYEFNNDSNIATKDLSFNLIPANDADIQVISNTYWKFIDAISIPGLSVNAEFGCSLSTTTDGRQILIGSKFDNATDNQGQLVSRAGSVYAIDRSVVRYQITDTNTDTYIMPGTVTAPVSVLLNGQFLNIKTVTEDGLITTDYINGQVDVDYDTNQITLIGVDLTIGDILEIETNQFQQLQKVVADNPVDESAFGADLDVCPTNCSLYVGSPLDSSILIQSGSVQRNINQSRIYGVTTSLIANPTLTAGNTIRVNNTEVAVPASPNNNVNGLVDAINNANIPNVLAYTTPDAEFIGNGVTKTFDIGSLYSDATSYTTVVYVGSVLQTAGVDYTYNATTKTISFVTAPSGGSIITVVSGRMTLQVKNSQASTSFNRLTVLPGVIGTAFASIGFETFVFAQTIISPNPVDYANFGQKVYIDSGAVNLVVAAPNGDVYEPNTFDGGLTYFDDRSTTFFNPIENCGVVYTYDFLPSATTSVTNQGKFAFGQQIYADNLSVGDQFGWGLNFTSGRLLIGAPNHDYSDSILNSGLVTVFDNPDRNPAWKVIHAQQPVVDVDLINTVFMYNKLNDSNEQIYFDFFDPLQGKILGAARRNIDFIGAVDPANYNTGSIHNQGNSWGSEHVGEIWWDTNSVRFIDPNQDELVYASRRWGQVFPGSRIDVYQWVQSSVPPVSYTGMGTPLTTTSYTIRSQLSRENIFETYYYFWVRNIDTINTSAGKTLSTVGIARYIESPRSSGIPYVAALNASTVAIYNGLEYISAADTILHIGYDRQYNNDNIHTEYQLIAAGRPDAFLNATLYRKLQDSLCGVDSRGAVVPDPFLSPAERYGVQFRPRQSMFVNRFTALQNYLERANKVLKQYPITESRSFGLLNSTEPEPSASSGAWNTRLANIEELSYQNIDSVPIGYRYLIVSDSSQNGLWTIYEVVNSDVLIGQRKLQLISVQTYDTRLYWYYIDWYLPGYNSTTQIKAEVPVYSSLDTLTLSQIPIGSSVKVTANAQGKFEIYLRTDQGWDRVGLEGGTIQFREEIWNYSAGNFGFDMEVFDAQYFDQEPTIETRKIIQAINEQLFIDDLAIERNQLLILLFDYVYSENLTPNWLLKTSLVDVDHKIRALLPFQTYLQDNQTFVLDYIQEVKPYHVQIREFNLTYDGDDQYPGLMTDFDVPAYWNSELLIPQYISPVLTPYTQSGSTVESTLSDSPADAEIWTRNPWNEWYNNYLLSVQSVTVIDGGTGYTVEPEISVSGPCIEEPVLQARINSAGQVIAVDIIDPGVGFSGQCIITFIGGNGSGARAIANTANDLVRSVNTKIKYDRCEYSSTIVEWQANVVYVNNTLVRYLNRVWQANNTTGPTVTGPTFDPAYWTLVDAGTLSATDRTMGYYTPAPNEPGLSLPLLIDGISYPGVQVSGLDFNQNTGFDVGNFDINPFDNIAYGPEGLPTYDPAVLDAIYESNYLDIYLGTRPTDVNVDGGAYVDTYSSHAPEELVPGAEFDTLDLRVYTRPGSDWELDGHGFLETVKVFVFVPGSTISFADIVPYPAQVIVFNQTLGRELYLDVDYTVNWAEQTITVNNATAGNAINVSVYEIGGGNQLYKQNYAGNDVGNQIVIPVIYGQIQELVVFVNGELINDYTYEAGLGGTTEVTFGTTYTITDFINFTAIGPTTVNNTTTNYSWSAPQTQYIVANGTSLNYALTNSLEYSNPDNLIVTVNGARARTSAGIEYLADGSSDYLLPTRLGFSQSLIANNEVNVYVNDIPQILGVDYTVEPYQEGDLRAVQFTVPPTLGETILVCVNTNAQCYVNGSELVFRTGTGLTPVLGDLISVTTWNDTRQQNILTKVYVGPVTTGATVTEGYDTTDFDPVTINNTPGSFDYSVGISITTNDLELDREIEDTSRLWVTLNGRRLFPGADFTVSGTELILKSGILSSTDLVMITEFTNSIVPQAMAFRIFQDMRGVQAVYRITNSTTTTLAQPLSQTEDIVYLEDASRLSQPDVTLNIWGVCMINGERIMYRERNIANNTISSLLRGTAGTAADDHATGATVTDMGRGNLLPEEFQNYIVSSTTLADGVTTVFVAENIDLEQEDSAVQDLVVEVYVAGIQIQDGYTIIGEGPVQVEFDLAPPNGVEITILVRRGVTWYAPGAGTPSNGIALQQTNTQAARFLRGE